MIINTNVSSLGAQEAAVNTGKNISSALEKLSTGLKINKASDDASGLAIADKLRTQASSLGQGISNANSASALIQIADKAMSEQSNILDVVKTKLLQASTSTTSDEGKAAIKNDVQKLLTQLDNITSQTNYNGTALLDGSSFSFQVGEKSSDVITASPTSASNTANLGTTSNNLTLAAGVVNTTGAATAAKQVDTLTFGDGGGTWVAGDTATVAIKQGNSDQSYSYSYTVTQADIDNDGTTAVEETVAAGLVALINGAAEAGNSVVATNTAGALTLTGDNNGERFETTASAGQNLDGLKDLTGNLTSAIAKQYMDVTDGALNDLNKIRSEFGSTQNQLESATRNMMTTQTNIKAAESIIRDVDYAQESANFNKQNIIAQAGTYAISQANAVQQNVSRLLQ